MKGQIASGVAEEVQAPGSFDDGERWYRRLATGTIWRLVPEDDPYGPGLWTAYEDIAA
jgi:hypothetical protein